MNWTTTDKLLLSTILPSGASRERLRKLIAERNDEIDWPQAFERARHNFISPLLRFNLVHSGLIKDIPKEQQQALETESLAWAARHLAYAHRVIGFIQTLNEHGINVLPLKGAALMLGNYYPTAGLRVAADLDLLIDPPQVNKAESIAKEQGFGELAPHQKQTTRAAQPLTYERRHLPTRCDANGIVLELHYRAFHNPRSGRDFGFAEMASRAVRREITGQELLLPAAEDLCLHLIQHTVVELHSAHAIPRTLADLFFVLQSEPESRSRLIARSEEFGMRGAVELTLSALQLIENVSLDKLDEIGSGKFTSADERDAAVLLDTALASLDGKLAETFRLFEYLDFRQQPRLMLTNLRTLFSAQKNSANLNARQAEDFAIRKWSHFPKQFFHLLSRFKWGGLKPQHVRRVLRLRKLTHEK